MTQVILVVFAWLCWTRTIVLANPLPSLQELHVAEGQTKAEVWASKVVLTGVDIVLEACASGTGLGLPSAPTSP